MKSFSNKVALITGAGSGIGRSLAKKLANQGCNLALVDWNNESLEETKEILRNKNVSVSTHHLDIRDREKIKELKKQCRKVLKFMPHQKRVGTDNPSPHTKYMWPATSKSPRQMPCRVGSPGPLSTTPRLLYTPRPSQGVPWAPPTRLSYTPAAI